MSNVVSCRSCDKIFYLRSKRHSALDFPKGIFCISCWSKPVNTINTKKSNNSSNAGGKSSFDISSVETKFHVGDLVYFNTNKFGVLKAQVIDIHCYGEGYVFYTVVTEDKNKTVDYLEEMDIFTSPEKAITGRRVTGV